MINKQCIILLIFVLLHLIFIFRIRGSRQSYHHNISAKRVSQSWTTLSESIPRKKAVLVDSSGSISYWDLASFKAYLTTTHNALENARLRTELLSGEGEQGVVGYAGSEGGEGDPGIDGDPGVNGTVGRNGDDGGMGTTGGEGSRGNAGSSCNTLNFC